MKISVPAAVWMVQSASLPGRRSLRVADWRPTSFSRLRFRRSSAWSIDHSSSFVACIGLSASQWSKASRTVLSTMRAASCVARRSLVWPWNSGSRMNTDSMAADVPITSSAVTCRRAAVVGQLAVGAQALGQRRAQAGLVRAAVGRRDGVAVGARETVVVGDPRHRPFDRAVAVLALGAAGEQILGHHGASGDLARQVVGEATREAEHGAGRRVVGDERRVARPADFHAAEQVSLGARHLEQARRLEVRALAEDRLVRMEAHLGATPVHHRAKLLQLALRQAAREHHAVELLAARHLDFADVGQRVDHRNADAVQTARGVVRLAVELAARVQHAHDDFERALVLELRMRIDGHAATVVGDRQEAFLVEFDLDPRGVSGDRLVHGVIDHLGEEVMHGLLVGAADVHAGAAAHRLKALQDLDIGGGIAVGGIGRPAGAGRFIGHEAFDR